MSNYEPVDEWLQRWGVWNSVTAGRVGPKGYVCLLGKLAKGPTGYCDMEDTEVFSWMSDCMRQIEDHIDKLNVAEKNLLVWKYKDMEDAPKRVWCAAYEMSGSSYDRCLKGIKESLWRDVVKYF